MTVPNMISFFRIILVGAFCYCYFIPGFRTIAFAILIISGISDLVDGYIARKFNQITNLGKILDPVADKLFHFSTIICFYISDIVDLWLVVLIFIKEAILAIGGLVFYKKNQTVIAAKWYGKVASSLFFFTFVVAFFVDYKKELFYTTGKIIIMSLFMLSLAVSIYAMINYVVTAVNINNKNKLKKEQVISDEPEPENGRKVI